MSQWGIVKKLLTIPVKVRGVFMKKILFISVFMVLFVNISFAQDMEMKMFKIESADVGNVYSVIKDLVTSQGKVTMDKNTSNIIVFDYSDNLARIEKVVKQLDVSLKQVFIKVTVAQVTNQFLGQFGLQLSEIIIPKGEFNLVLQALSSSQSSRINSQMSIRTMSNHPASLNVSREEIFGHKVTQYKSGKKVIEYEYKEIGDFLEVLPRVSANNLVTIVVRPSVSTFSKVNGVENREIITQIVVNDGDTVMLGGVDSDFYQQGSDGKKQNAKKVVMFLTVNVDQ